MYNLTICQTKKVYFIRTHSVREEESSKKAAEKRPLTLANRSEFYVDKYEFCMISFEIRRALVLQSDTAQKRWEAYTEWRGRETKITRAIIEISVLKKKKTYK